MQGKTKEKNEVAWGKNTLPGKNDTKKRALTFNSLSVQFNPFVICRLHLWTNQKLGNLKKPAFVLKNIKKVTHKGETVEITYWELSNAMLKLVLQSPHCS